MGEQADKWKDVKGPGVTGGLGRWQLYKERWSTLFPPPVDHVHEYDDRKLLLGHNPPAGEVVDTRPGDAFYLESEKLILTCRQEPIIGRAPAADYLSAILADG